MPYRGNIPCTGCMQALADSSTAQYGSCHFGDSVLYTFASCGFAFLSISAVEEPSADDAAAFSSMVFHGVAVRLSRAASSLRLVQIVAIVYMF